MHPRLLSLLLTLLLLTLLAAPAAAQQTSFDQALQAIDTVPTREQLDARWPDALDRLIAAATDPNQDLYARSRAISLLSAYPSPEVRKLLTQIAADPDPAIRKLAVYTAGRTFGTPGDPQLVDWLLTFLNDPSDRVRDHAIRALRWIDHPQADTALTHLTLHTNPDLASLARITRERRKRRLTQ